MDAGKTPGNLLIRTINNNGFWVMGKIILLRHGESEWNQQNRFTGWTDVTLTRRGEEEARHAAGLIKQAGIQIDSACTSVLNRAIHSLWLIMETLNLLWLPVSKTWRLNERHYGALQGMRKDEAAQQMGEELVYHWRKKLPRYSAFACGSPTTSPSRSPLSPYCSVRSPKR